MHSADDVLGIPEDRVVALADDEAARDDLGPARERAGRAADRHDGDDDAVSGEVTTIAQHLVGHLARACRVDEHAARRRLLREAGPVPVELDDVAVLRQEDLQLAVGPAHDALRHPRMLGELAVLAMDRHEIAWLDQREHELQLLGAGVSRHVHVLHVVGDHGGPAPGDVAHRPRDCLLVARDRPRREHYRIVGTDLDVAMVVDGDAGQRRPRLALRPGSEAEHVLRRVALNVHVTDLQPGRNAQEPETLGDLGVLDHAAADEGDLAVELRREIDENLHPVDARGKGGDHQLAVCAGEDLLERLDDLDFGTREAASIDIRAVREQREHALAAQLGEAMEIEVLTVDRRLVDLEVARVHDRACRARDGQRHTIRHAVRHPDEFDLERTDSHFVARLNPLEAFSGVDTMLHEFRLDERKGHGRAVDRTIEERHDIRHAADVILVAMGQDQRLQLAAPRLDVREIGDNKVDAKLIRFREHHAGIDQDGGVLPRDRHHVHAELAQAAERDDLERGRRDNRNDGLIHSEPSTRGNELSCTAGTTLAGHQAESGRWERLQNGKGQRLAKKL